MAAGRNGLINGGMDIWQRGTTSASITTTATYTSDRWVAVSGASTATVVSRQTTSDTTNLPNIQYCARVQRTAGQTGTSVVQIAQSMESVNSVPFAGKAVTVSFYARKGANYSETSSALSIIMLTGTGTDQQVLTGYTGSATAINTSATLTTTWQRFSFNATLATNTNEIGVDFYYTPSGTAGAADYFEVTGIQLELGSVATNFSRAGGNIQGELAACQRYYCRWTGGAAYHPYGLGFATSTTAGAIIVNSPVAMRVAPTTIDYSTIYLEDYASASSTAGTVSAFNAGPLVTKLNFTGLSGMTAGRGIYIYSNNDANGYLAFSAEL
jgi:hypothetical protein